MHRTLTENHQIEQTGRLRTAVPWTNDDIVSTVSLILGVIFWGVLTMAAATRIGLPFGTLS